jgi:SynChlorMet cassette protein ScmD
LKNGKKPIANPYVLLREEFDDWAILFNPDTGRGFGLSPTGVYVWKLLDGEHTIADLLKELRPIVEGVPEDAGDHIEHLLMYSPQRGSPGSTGAGLAFLTLRAVTTAVSPLTQRPCARRAHSPTTPLRWSISAKGE